MTLRVLAPAKINLGLEVIGRRPDGYHEIATVMVAVSLFDRLTLSLTPELTLAVDSSRGLAKRSSLEEIGAERNLAMKAAMQLQERAQVAQGAEIRLTKRIPMAAGLGGASSDAAAVLVALRALWGTDLSEGEIEALAAALGSDVPFFLSGGTALARGRGEVLTRLPRARLGWFVIAVPNRTIERKTARLYGMLGPEDYTSGEDASRVATLIANGKAPPPALLRNAFERPILELMPEVTALREAFLAAGAPFVALSGAGPALYTRVDRLAEAVAITWNLRQRLGDSGTVHLCRPVDLSPLIASDGDSGLAQRSGPFAR